jgi:hypothetical protein
VDVINIIIAYNPLFSPEKENVIMVPLDYVEEVEELAKLHNANIEVFYKRKSKYAYIRWYPRTGEKDE